MKNKNLWLKLIAMALVVCTATLLFAGCGKKEKTVVMSFTADVGDETKTYTITEQEFDMLMKIRKRIFFCNLLYTTSKDTARFWNEKNSTEKEKTNEQYYKDLVMDQVKAVLVEKYLFEANGLTISQDTLDGYKSSIKTAEKETGGKGAYKQYYGFTAKLNYEVYEPMVDRSEMLYKALCADGAMLAANAENLKAYYEEHYVGYQYIMIDLKNKVLTDEDGNRLYTQVTKKDDKGNVVKDENGKEVKEDGDSYQTEKYDSTKEEDKDAMEKKQNLGKSILQELEAGTITFEEAIAKYSDAYYSVEFAEGTFVDKESTFINTTVQDKIKDLEVGETYAEVIASGDYHYIVKRVDLKAGVYEEYEKDENGEIKKDEEGKNIENKYFDQFTDFEETVEYDNYEKYVESFFDKITIVEPDILASYTMQNTFLSPYVDYYYQMILYYYYGIQM